MTGCVCVCVCVCVCSGWGTSGVGETWLYSLFVIILKASRSGGVSLWYGILVVKYWIVQQEQKTNIGRRGWRCEEKNTEQDSESALVITPWLVLLYMYLVTPLYLLHNTNTNHVNAMMSVGQPQPPPPPPPPLCLSSYSDEQQILNNEFQTN